MVGVQFVADMLALAGAYNQTSAHECLQVAGDGRLGEVEKGHDLADCPRF